MYGRCVDPCTLTQCGRGAQCRAEYHQAVCYCPSGLKGDPKVECANSKQTCRRFLFLLLSCMLCFLQSLAKGSSRSSILFRFFSGKIAASGLLYMSCSTFGIYKHLNWLAALSCVRYAHCKVIFACLFILRVKASLLCYRIVHWSCALHVIRTGLKSRVDMHAGLPAIRRWWPRLTWERMTTLTATSNP